MPQFRTVHLLPALIVVALSLVFPLLASGGAATGSAGSVVARAAQAGTTGGDLRFPVGSPQMEAAKATATAYWGAQPCGGTYTLQWTPLDVGTNATASWRNPTDAWNNATENFDCRIDINPNADYDYAKLCTVLTHEIGHLLGRPHDPSTGQLMSAYYTSPIAQCGTAEPAPAATAPGTENADYAESDFGVAATDEPKRSLRKKTTQTVKKVKRCKIVKKRVFKRTKSGKRVKTTKRVKRCTMVTAKTAAKKDAKRKTGANAAQRR